MVQNSRMFYSLLSYCTISKESGFWKYRRRSPAVALATISDEGRGTRTSNLFMQNGVLFRKEAISLAGSCLSTMIESRDSRQWKPMARDLYTCLSVQCKPLRHGHQPTLAYPLCLQPLHPNVGTRIFEKCTEPSHPEVLFHIMEHRRLLFAGHLTRQTHSRPYPRRTEIS